MEVRECIKQLSSQLPLNNSHKENNLYEDAIPPIKGYSSVLSELLETQTPEIYRRK